MTTQYAIGRETGHALAEEALEILQGQRPAPEPRVMRIKQTEARALGHDYALALWSRLRWQWVVATGQAEVHS